MQYIDVNDVKKYARNVEEACGRTGVPAKFPEETWEGNVAYVEAMYNDLRKTTSKKNFEKYAQAIYLAAHWLNGASTEEKQEKQPFFTHHIATLKQGAEHLLHVHIPAPRVVYEASEARTTAATIFFQSPVFKELLAYRDFLKDYRGNHFFGLLHNRNDYHILNELIQTLSAQKSMEGIQAVFEDFYHENSQDGHSRYDAINRRQDILSYILSLFGVKEKTSTALLDEISKYAKNLYECNSVDETPVWPTSSSYSPG
ncbi:hypothetical protein [Legionella jamestowniensis]|uniref:Uncharacterized protein n=1 Tax=Legionella jamestowniensis TaxID=455 RepID=A0A0W0UTZ8_9GAMM|nr:hypothetical protein [Legionella jamestowniensis]KTD11333.1 hypothetical protein Ljam_0527 [Legionella jamestowniensis]OCH98807.1 hypothetical protein A8135_10925 [Legionella jamestowniensis]SFL68930.1 hypothetical protein SAMN02746073_1386 [Legionella jamestowniensis DSM 19215]